MTKTIEDVVEMRIGVGRRVVPSWVPKKEDPNAKDTEVEWFAYGESEDKPIAGVWQGEPDKSELTPYPYDEVVVMLTGAVALIDRNGERRVFRAGESFIIPKGFEGYWETLEPGSSKAFVTLPSD